VRGGRGEELAEQWARAERLQARFEWPVVVAAFLTIPVIALQESNLGAPWPTLAKLLNWLTWSIFALEVIVMLSVVPSRREWARRHLLDMAVTVLTPPFAPAAWQAGRVFRLFRLLRVVRLFSLRRLLSLEGMKYAALVAAGTVLLGGAVFANAEREHGVSTWDGIWWAVTTVTTVGYGDIEVHSDAGRIIAITIMLVGIGFVALLTAFIADRFISQQQETEEKEDQVLEELKEIRLRLEALEQASSTRAGPGSS
jgi:voltage-gated potassium channel